MPRTLSETVFLVSGGGRGVTARCVIELARAHGGAFVLLGRTALDASLPFSGRAEDPDLKGRIAAYLRSRDGKATPARIERLFRQVTGRDEILRTLDAIAQAGGRADYLAVDVTDADALRAGLARLSPGPITGIIHGAGVLSDGLIERTTEAEFDRVYRTKVHGLHTMLASVDAGQLSFLALFSSVAGLHGNRGQAGYAVANEVLNKFAHAFKAAHPACHTTVFDWGPWDGGMVGPELRELFAQNAVTVMPIDAGARVFVETLAGGNLTTQLAVNDVPPRPPAGGRLPVPGTRVTRRLTLAGNAFLRDHTIGGHAVLPAACAGLWMANTCLALYPGHTFHSLSGFRVLKGVVFDEGLAPEHVVTLDEAVVSDQAVAQAVLVGSTTAGGKPRYHYGGTVRLSRSPAVAPRFDGADLSRDAACDALRPYADGALFHGPHFQGITRILNVGPRRITVECRRATPAAGVEGQFPATAFDPVWADLQFQCLGLWAHHRMGAAALPLSCRDFQWYSAPPVDAPCLISAGIEGHTAHAVVATIHLHAADGRVFASMFGAELTISRRLNRHFGAADTASAQDEQVSDHA